MRSVKPADVVGGRVEGQAYVAVGAGALDAQRQSVPVDGERLDPDGAVQAVRLDEPGEALHGVGVGVGEMREQVRLGGGERVGLGVGELLEVDDDRTGGLFQYDTGGMEGEVAVLGGEPAYQPEPSADTAADRDGRHVRELQHGGRLAAGRADRGRQQGAVLGNVQDHPAVLVHGVRTDELLAPAVRGHRAGP